jgi:hypothetical protein
MRRTFIAVLIMLLLAPELPARNNRDWENVKTLKRGTAVVIMLWNGQNLGGEIDHVSDVGLQLATADPQGVWVRALDRTIIRRIVRTRQIYLPDAKRWMVTGAVAGGAIGVTAGTVLDVRHGENFNWFTDGLGGASMGFLASTMALAGVGAVDIARGPRSKVVYEDKGNHPPPTH